MACVSNACGCGQLFMWGFFIHGGLDSTCTCKHVMACLYKGMTPLFDLKCIQVHYMRLVKRMAKRVASCNSQQKAFENIGYAAQHAKSKEDVITLFDVLQGKLLLTTVQSLYYQKRKNCCISIKMLVTATGIWPSHGVSGGYGQSILLSTCDVYR